ncbi:PDR/VanB family oxidoreductase [Nocardia spumae]|uniref:PDR/VanB family oxidoreductase n=1 Tax=Nocardia spumae TaxID=2887190 RepID=UPI001D149B94|nr:PDR/VanB family oxidoreductase [Nocardia spumae]
MRGTPRLVVPQTRPPNPWGRDRPDRLLDSLEALLELRVRWTAITHSRRHPTPAVNNRLFPLRVGERDVVAGDDDVVALTLGGTRRAQLPAWYPGAHLDIQLPSGRIRQYSLCGDPADRHRYRIAVRRVPDGGGGSRELHRLPVGSVVHVRGPRNAFGFIEPVRVADTGRVRFIAGGIGITPILPMVREAEHMGLDWTLVYVGRNRGALPFLDELARLGQRVVVRTDDDHGLPTADDLLPVDLHTGDVIYCCGPIPLMDMVAARVRDAPGVELHSERFSPKPVVDGRPFRIQLARSGEVVHVDAHETALEAVLEVDSRTPYSCRQGFCGACRVRVVAGTVDHRDTMLSTSDREAGMMLLCVSRAESGSLTLDL